MTLLATGSEEEHRVAPAAALAMLDSHSGPVIVDFDETLFLRNSTEEFLDCARPALPARLLLQALDLVGPWRWTGGAMTRDNWRIALVSLLFPWIWPLWRARVSALAARWTNPSLARHLQQRTDVSVASIGFTRIIAPLLHSMRLTPQPRLIACRIVGAHDRLAGKRALVANALGEKCLGRALVITDSRDDADILAACGRACLTVWPRAQWRGALERVYLPFTYLSRVKRPGSRYLWRSIVQEDYVFWVLATLAGATMVGAHLLGLAFLLVSFWAVYETGYVDNDRMGARHEADPKLSPAFAENRVPTPVVTPWLWAGAAGYAGLAMLSLSLTPPTPLLLAWAGVLLATHGIFRLFNRIDKRSRIWLFGLLQFTRTASIGAVATISPIGAAGLAAHLVALWIPYVFYRYGGDQEWQDLPVFCARLLFFLLFGALILAAIGPGVIHWGIAAAFLAWNLFRARKELPRLVRQVERIDTAPPRR